MCCDDRKTRSARMAIRFLSNAACGKWCRNHRYRWNSDLPNYQLVRVEVIERSKRIKLSTPQDSGRKLAFAKHISQTFTTKDEWLLWITNWSVWPSCEHMPLYQRIRSSHGGTSTLVDEPGHLIDATSSDDLVSLLFVCLSFFWDFYLLDDRGTAVVKGSHDEYAEISIAGGNAGKVIDELKNLVA